MKSQRQLQIGENIKRTISEIFLRDDVLSFPGSYITVLEADVSPDAKNVKIFIDIFGNESKHDEIIKKINAAAPHFRFQLSKSLVMRYMPEITFILDKTESRAAVLEQVISQEGLKYQRFAKKTVRKKKSK